MDDINVSFLKNKYIIYYINDILKWNYYNLYVKNIIHFFQ